MHGSSICSASSPVFLVWFSFAILIGVYVVVCYYGLLCISLITSDVQHLFMCLFPSVYLFTLKCLSTLFPTFIIGCLFWDSLPSLGTRHLSDTWFESIFPKRSWFWWWISRSLQAARYNEQHLALIVPSQDSEPVLLTGPMDLMEEFVFQVSQGCGWVKLQEGQVPGRCSYRWWLQNSLFIYIGYFWPFGLMCPCSAI